MLKMLHWHISLHMKFPQQMEDIAWWKELFTTQKLSTSYARCILQFLLQTSKLIFIETIIKCDASWTHNYLIQYFLHIRLVWRWLVTKIVIPASQGSNRGCTKKKSPCRASLKKCGRVPACANSAVQPWSYWQWAPAKDCQHCQGSIFLNKHLTIRINKLLLALFVYRISKN